MIPVRSLSFLVHSTKHILSSSTLPACGQNVLKLNGSQPINHGTLQHSIRGNSQTEFICRFVNTSAVATAIHSIEDELGELKSGNKNRKDKLDDKAIKPKTKQMVIRTKIGEHDLQVKTQQILKWLKKGCHVAVSMESSSRAITNQAKLESEIFKAVTESAKDVATIQKSKKTASGLTFELKPNSEHVHNTKIKPLSIEELNALKEKN